MNPLALIDGYKTTIAGLMGIGLAIALALKEQYVEAMTVFVASMGALGLGGKLDKNTEAVNRLTQVTVEPAVGPAVLREIEKTTPAPPAPPNG